MKEFAIYTGLRLSMFVVAFWCFVIAFAVSGVASYFLLNPFREAFARKVQARAERATARFEELRSREDQ